MNSPRRTDATRKNRQITDDAWIQTVLKSSPAGVLGFSDGNQPYVNGNLFVYDPVEHVLFFHTARQGRTRQVVEQNARAVFTVFQMGRLLPGPEAVDFSVEYRSVVVFGNVTIETDPTRKSDILARWFVKYAPHLKMGVDFGPFKEADVARTTVYRLDIEAWSGKEHCETDDFPNAYEFGKT